MIRKIFLIAAVLSMFFLNPFLLKADGSVSGCVTDTGSNGIANVNVHIQDLNGSWITQATTDSNGDYTVSGIPAGDYKVWFGTQDTSGSFVGEYYNDKGASLGDADTVTVTDGSTTSGIDAQLADGGFISGRVTDVGSNGIANVNVNVHDTNGNNVACSSTDSNGDYTVQGVPAGDNKVTFWPGNSSYYIEEWYNDQGSFDDADAVTVTVGNTTAGIDAQLADGGVISGRVTDGSSSGIQNVEVDIYDSSNNFITNFSTDSNGDYTSPGLPGGDYKVWFNTQNTSGNFISEWYNDKGSFEDADAVTITNGSTTTGIDAQLATGGIISGKVMDSSLTGIENVVVSVYDSNFNWINDGWTDSNGDYIIRKLPTNNYKLYFDTSSAGNYLREWYNDKGDFDSADVVSVTAGSTTGDINAELADGGGISGRVTDSTGTVGISNVDVQVCDLSQYWLYGTSTDSDGYYTIYGTEAGSYKVEFRTDWAPGNYVREWYNDQVSFYDADTVTVTVGSTTTGIDAQLADGGSISGRVTDAGSNGIANVDVNVNDMNGNAVSWTSTDSNGDYTVPRIPSGDHKVQFWAGSAGNYISEWYNDQGSFEDANAVTVTAGSTTTGIDAQLAEGGSVSGRVTDSTGTVGIENVDVQIYDMTQYHLTGTSTDSDGYYTISGLSSGDYKIEFRTNNTPGNYVGEWYNDKNSFQSANTVSVTVGQTTTGIDALLADGGAVSGRVTDSTGTVGITNVNVQICDLNQNWLNGISTDSSGYYTIYGLPAGNYKIQFTTEWAPGNYAGEWYNDKNTFENADAVSVTVGQTTTGIDTQLAEGGYISGRVTDSTGTVGIADVSVQICDLSQNWFNGTSTNSEGYYTINGLSAGDYKVEFQAYNTPGNYLGEWYNDKNSFESADTVSVTAGQTTTGIDAQLADGGGISGRVTDSTGTVGITNVDVQICDLNQNWLNGVSTDSNGYYTIYGLPAGNYKIQFRTDWAPGNYVGEWYNDQGSFNDADTVTVTVGSTTSGIDAQLADGGSISGRVTDVSSNGIANIDVNVHDMNGNYIAWSSTDSNGDYTVQGIPAGDHKVQFWVGNAGNYITEWYNDQESFENANAVTVTAGNTTTGIDAQLADSGAISGRVTDSTGAVGISNVNVQICDLNQDWLNGNSTDSDGYYTIYGLPAGDYKIEFRTNWTPGNYLGEWYNDQGSFDDADSVTVTVGSTTTGIDAQLADGGGIGGRVTDSTGTVGIANVHVQICDLDQNFDRLNGVSTDGNGYYTIYGLPAGDYKIQFNTDWAHGSYVGEWYDDKNSFENGDTISVTVGQTTTGIDAQLADGGFISGRVTDVGSNGISNVNVNIYDLSNNYVGSASTNSNGDYTVQGIPEGDHKVQFDTGNAGNYLEEWYNDRGTFADADSVTVTAGSTTSGIDAQLTMGGIISGKVMDSSLIGIENVHVIVYDLNSSWINSTWTDNNGDYLIQGFYTNNYKVYFDTSDTGNYLSEWYNDKSDFENADEVTITAGTTTNNINAVLADGGSISGRVTDSTGTIGISNVDVQIRDLNQNWFPGTNTDSDGYYTLNGLPAGDYKIEFRTQWTPGNYVGEWFNDKNSFESADAITVTVGQTTTGIDALLADGGAVSGRVTDASGTFGLPNVNINICDPDQHWLHGVGTDNDGYYTIYGVPDGSYKIQFDGQNAGNYAQEWWDNKRNFEDADTVVVTTGNTTAGINAQLEDAGSITGTVTDDSTSAGIENVRVIVYDLSNNEINSSWTDANGDYTVDNLYPGNFKVHFDTSDVPIYIAEWYNDKDSFENGDEVVVNEGSATTVNAGLAAVQDDNYEPNDTFETAVEMTMGTFNDLVYLSPDGEGVEQDWYKVYIGPEHAGKDLKVHMKVTSDYPPDPPGWWGSDLDFEIFDSSGNRLAIAISSSDDETLYISNLAEGWYYINLSYCTLGYGPDGAGVHAIYSMTVEVGDSNTFGIGYISGRVTDEQGQGIGYALIQMVHSPYDWSVSLPTISTDSDGYYTIGYAPGDYTVEFNDLSLIRTHPAPNYVPEYYNDKTLLDDAEVLTIQAGVTITGINAELIAGATIEGTLTHSNGNPIVDDNQAYATAYDKNSMTFMSYCYNDSNGNYSIKYLPPGTYKIRFRGWDENWNRYAREWYDNKPTFGTGDDVTISTVGEVISGINNQFSDGGIIQGRVTNEPGGGIGNVLVRIYHPSDSETGMVSGWTNGNGDFYIREVSPGNVKVYFDADDENTAYVSEWYNDKGSFNDADLVSITAGQTTSEINAQLLDKGKISGRVTNSSGTLGIENVDITVYDLDNNDIGWANTDENGYYTVNGIPAGDKKVEFSTGNASGNYLGEWYNDKNSFENGDTVAVTDGQTTTGIDAQLTQGGEITGQVTDSSTNGIKNVNVNIYDMNNNWISGDWTDVNGDYTVQRIPAGEYKVHFNTGNAGNYLQEWYENQGSFDDADTVTVTAGSTISGIDAQLETGGIIIGKVMDSYLIGIENIQVIVHDLNNNWISDTWTDINGDYIIRGFSTSNYKVYFDTGNAGNYLREWYQNKSDFDSADEVPITAGNTTYNINAVLEDGGGISGRVTDSTGTLGIANVEVQICDLNGYWYPGTNTDSAGYYTLRGLPAGDYKVEFRTHWTPGDYVGEWYNDKNSFESADAISVIVGQTFTGIDAQLADGGAVSGRVTDSSGTNGINNVNINICDLDQSWLYGVSTDNDGYYTIHGVPAGSYKIQFDGQHAGNYAREWWDNKRNFEDADTVVVTTGNTTADIDAQLEDAGSIFGTVTDDSTSNGIENVRVIVYDLSNNEINNSWTDANGDYTVDSLYPGNFKVHFDTSNVGIYISEWYNDKDSFENGDEVVVNEGTATTADAGLAAVQDDNYEPNDTFETAVEMTMGTYNDLVYLSPDGEGVEKDWYKVYVGPEHAGKDLKVHVKVTSDYPPDPPSWWNSDIDFVIFDSSGNILGKVLSSTDDETLYISNLTEGWYYINVNFCTIGYGPDGTGVHAIYSMTIEVGDSNTFGIGYISGRVTDEQGQGIGYALIQMMHSPNDWSVSFPTISTDSDGYYTIGYHPGDYTLLFNYFHPLDVPPAPNYVSEFYNDKSSRSEAEVLSIHAGASITGINAELMAGATIEGTLTHSNGNPIVDNRQAWAVVYDENNSENWVSYDYNDSSGNYSVKYLPPGTYKIRFGGRDENWIRYAREWYDNKLSFGTGDDVIISTVGEVVSGINAQFSEAGIIQGRVTNEAAQGIGDVKVLVYNPSDPGYSMIYGYTNGNGDFYINQVFPGDVKVYFDADDENTAYISEWYNDKGSFNDADLVSVTGGQTTSNINAQLSDKGQISGRVTDSSTNGIENVDINVYDLDNNNIGWSNTDENGYYTVDGVPAGDCKVQFGTFNVSGNYLGEWYNDKNSFENADTVNVTNGQTTTGIDAQLTDGGAISGRVTDSSTNGIENVYVTIYTNDNNWNAVNGTTTDSNGDYTVDELPAGDYKIQFETHSTTGVYYIGEWYNDKGSIETADAVTVTSGNTTTGVDAQLADGGAVSGRVTDSTGTFGIPNVDVQICDLNHYWLPGTSTDSDGYYTIRGLPSGDYKVEFRTNNTPGNYVGEWYNDKNSFENADTVSVTVGQSTTGIDAQLAGGGSISGCVTDSSTNGIENVNVNVYDLNNNYISSSSTDSNGDYTVQGILPGDCKVYFETGSAGNYLPEWYDDKGAFDDADAVTVTAGQTLGNIDAQLADGGVISGQVTNESSEGIEGVRVRVRDLNGDWVASTNTDSNGDYTIEALAPGSYKVDFNTSNANELYVSEYYNDKDSFSTADIVDITAGGTTIVDAVLADGCAVSGQVTNASSTGIQDVRVDVRNLNYSRKGYAYTDENGNYTVVGLPEDSYKVYFNAYTSSENYMPEWYNDKDSFDNGDTISVTAGQTLTGIDAVLSPGGTISGTVADGSSNPIEFMEIDVYDTSGNFITYGYTDSSGNYEVNGLATTSYKVNFNPWELNYYAVEWYGLPKNYNYKSEWYNNKENFIDADIVSVTVGNTTANIDAVMTDGEGGIISGQIADSLSNGIEGGYVYVMRSEDDRVDWYYSDDYYGTGADGNYQVKGLPTGNYIVWFLPPGGSFYRRQFYDNTMDIDNATLVSVTSGQTTSGINAVLQKGGTLSGRVTDSNGNGLKDVTIRLMDSTTNKYLGWIANSASTDVDGYYTVNAQAGQWKVMFQTSFGMSGNGYVSEFYDDQSTVENAVIITVNPEDTVSNIDAVLSSGGGKISGYVKDTTDAGLYDVSVNVYDTQYKTFVGHAYTDTSGYFEVPGLIPGNYKIYTIYNDVYPSEWYSDKTTFETADTVTVTDGGNTEITVILGGSNPSLPSITGRVTDSASSGINNVNVYIYDLNNNFVYSTSTNSNGDYTVENIPSESYKVYFEGSAAGNHVDEWYDDKGSFDEADPVTVTAGQTLENIDAQLTDGGVISGRVTNESSEGIEGAQVRVRDLNWVWIESTYSDSNGDYSIQALAAGSYKVYFNTGNTDGLYVKEWYNNKDSYNSADPVAVTAGNTTTVDAVLAEGGALSGTVTDESSNPIEFMEVDVYDTNGNFIDYDYTDNSGNYEVKGLPAGSYKVNFNPFELNYYGVEFGLPKNYNYKIKWYNNRENFIDADMVSVTVGNITPNINAVMTDGEGGIISGQITDSLSNGLEGCSVYVFQSEDDLDWYYSDDYYGTGADGNYEVKGLPTGNYIVLFFPPGGSLYRRQFYDNTLEIDNATLISVTAGQTTEGIDAVLQKGGTISGRVTNSGGNGLEDVRIRLMDSTTNKYLGWIGNGTSTDADGYYTVNAQAGQWKVMFQTSFGMSDNGYVSEFYNDQSLVENAAIISVTAEGAVSDIDAVLSAGGGKISGYVKDPGDTGLSNVSVDVYDTQYKTYVGHANTDNSGYFEVVGLIPGNYKVYTSYYNIYPSEWYSDKTTYETANPAAVINGGNTQISVVLGDVQIPSLINIISPNGGETWEVGTTQSITWESSGISERVKIEYSINNGASWTNIDTSVLNHGVFNWTVPDTPSDECLVRISAADSDIVQQDVSDAVFSIVPASSAAITVTSPNGGESLTVGSTHEITWTTIGTVGNVKIEYSINSGDNWTEIIASTSNTGSHMWTVPDDPSDNCLVRISEIDGEPLDVSDGEFFIVSLSTITVTSPNGGESLITGTTHEITWTSTGMSGNDNVTIEYSPNNGVNWVKIVPTTANNGSYDWTVPDNPSGNCLVRVSASDSDAGPSDVSDEVFFIVSQISVIVTSPNGGESLTVGSEHEITWTFTGMEEGDNIKIEYSIDSGTTWGVIVLSISNIGSDTWTVPDDPSENCLVRVSGSDSDEGPSDVSDEVFFIVPAPIITVTSPNGGEQWLTGSAYNITWTSSNVTGDVNIYLYAGESFDLNIGTASVDSGTFEWTIPGTFTVGDDYKVLVFQDSIEDYSDESFSIMEMGPNNPDFNNDGKVDILWRNVVTGANEVWYMDEATHISTASLLVMSDLYWRIVGTGDFNQDGKVDILWRRYTDGKNLVWYMDGVTRTGEAYLLNVEDSNWKIVGTGDFNGDAKVDIVWRNAVEARNMVWYMDGVTRIGIRALPKIEGQSWQIAGTGDFNEDNKVDILWRNYENGSNQVWYMDGVTRIGTADLMQETGLDWQIVGTGDFNLDGELDILWRRYSDGQNMIWYMAGVVRTGYEYIETRSDLNWRIVNNGD